MPPFKSSLTMMTRGVCLCSARIATLLLIAVAFLAAPPAGAESDSMDSPSFSSEEESAPLTFNPSNDPSGGFDDQPGLHDDYGGL